MLAILCLPAAALSQTPIACGQTTTNAIGAAGEHAVYTYTVTGSNTVTIRMTRGANSEVQFHPYLEVYAEDGSLVAQGPDKVDLALTDVGVYTFVARDRDNLYTGDYAVTWESLDGSCAPALACGQVAAARVDLTTNAPPWGFYALNVGANERVTIRVSRGGTSSQWFQPYLEVYGAGGNLLGQGVNKVDLTLTNAGVYLLVARDQYNLYTGDYAVTWERVNGSCAQALACGRAATGRVDVTTNAAPWGFYTLNVGANEPVTIRMSAGGNSEAQFHPYLEMYGTDGNLLTQGPDQLDLTLTNAGTYMFVARDQDNWYAGDYAVTWERLSGSCAPALACGQVAAARVDLTTNAPPWGFYRLNVGANERVTIRMSRGGTSSQWFQPYLEVYATDGSLLAQGANRVDMTLTNAGAYTLVARDQYNLYTGDYAVTWERVNGSCAQALACGQVATGRVDITANAAPWGFYTLNVGANEPVTIRMSAGTNSEAQFHPYLEVYATDGSLVAQGPDQLDLTLTNAGAYMFVARDQDNWYAGDYAVTWQRLIGSCAQALACGQVVTGRVDITTNAPPWGFYRLNVGANERVTIRVSRGGTSSQWFQPYLELYATDGSLLAQGANKVDMTLTNAGAYTLVARDQYNLYTGDYAVTWERVNGSCAQALACGQVATGRVDITANAAPWGFNTLTVVANEPVTIRMSAGTNSEVQFHPYLEVYGTDGNLLAQGTDKLDLTLTNAGTYMFVARDQDNLYAGDYAVTWERLSGSCAQALACGQVATGRVDITTNAPPWGFYKVNVGTNERVTIRMSRGGTSSQWFQPYLEVYATDGSLLSQGANRVDMTLTNAGAYTLVARDQYNLYTGDYAVTWESLSNPCNAQALSCGWVVTNNLIGQMGKMDVYRLAEVVSNDMVTVRMVATSGTLSPFLELYDGRGMLIASGDWPSYGMLTARLTSAGPYTLLARDSNNNGGGHYSLALQRPSNACNATILSVGPIASGSITQVDQIDAYRFSAAAGEDITICIVPQTNSLNPVVQLYDANGTLLTNGLGQVQQHFASGGSFNVLINDYNSTGTGTYKLTVSSGLISCGSLDLTDPAVTVTAPNGGEVIDAGSNFLITWTANDNVGISNQEIRLSTDGGATFPTVIATGLAGNVQSNEWSVPNGLTTTAGRIRVIAQDAAGNSGYDDSDNNFTVNVSVMNPFETWQMEYFGCSACAQAAATADPDGDGMNNLREFQTGTDPTNSASAFRITDIARQSNDVRVTWMTGTGKTNALQAAPGGAGGSYSNSGFSDIFSVTNATGSTTNFLDVNAATNSPSRFYRVRLVP